MQKITFRPYNVYIITVISLLSLYNKIYIWNVTYFNNSNVTISKSGGFET